MGKGFPQALLWLILLALISSCTTVSFEGKGLIPLYLTARPDHTKYVRIEGRKEFYLWGLIAPDRQVFLDEEFYDNGLVSVAAIDIHEYQKTTSFLKALLSLGFYIPKDYVISAHGVAPGNNRETSREYRPEVNL